MFLVYSDSFLVYSKIALRPPFLERKDSIIYYYYFFLYIWEYYLFSICVGGKEEKRKNIPLYFYCINGAFMVKISAENPLLSQIQYSGLFLSFHNAPFLV